MILARIHDETEHLYHQAPSDVPRKAA
jgi:hypothetical protein